MRTTAFAVAAAILFVAGPAFAQQPSSSAGGEASGGVAGSAHDAGPSPGLVQSDNAGDPDRYSSRVTGSRAADRNRAPDGDEGIVGGKESRRTARGGSNSPAVRPSEALRRLPGTLPGTPTPSISGPATPSGRGVVGAREHGESVQGIDLTTPDGGYGVQHRRAAGPSLMVNTPKKASPFIVRRYGTRSPGVPPRVVTRSRNAIGALPRNGVEAAAPGPVRPGLGGYALRVPNEGGTGAGPASVPGTTALGGLARGGTDVNRLGDVHIPAVRAPVVPVNPSANAAAINGTAIGRIAARSGTIGGPAKDRSAINGTSIRPRF